MNTPRQAIRADVKVIERDDPDYETGRTAIWNARKPDRFPQAIATPGSAQETAAAVAFARAEGLRVSVRSGGHSMCASSIRDGGLLIDLYQLRSLSVDPKASTFAAEAAVTSREIAATLGRHGLGFPIGHHGSVPVGGYLLSGGLGWNMRRWGAACDSLDAIEVVTADGKVVRADTDHHPELLWAARGGGPGFPGIVTSFHLRAHQAPGSIRTSLYLYPLAEVETVSRWASDIVGELPDTIEMMIMLASAPPGSPAGPAGKVVGVIATAFADDDEQAAANLSVLEGCPALPRALAAQPNQPASFDALFAMLAQRLPEGHRYAEDTIWSDDPLSALLPRLAEHLVTAPSPRSLFMATMHPFAGKPRPATAFSLSAASFVLGYSIWDDPTADADNEAWLRAAIASLTAQTAGHYVAESDLLASPTRPARSYTPAGWEQLRAIRRQWDPTGLICDFLGIGENLRAEVGTGTRAARNGMP